jgi:drug/metabolite transporter (DMT)-like permease
MSAVEKSGVRGFFLALATAVLWGGMPLLLRGMIDYLDPLTATGYRYCLCLLGNAAYVWLLGNSNWRNLRDRRVLILVGICVAGMLFNNVLVLFGLKLIENPGSVQVIGQLGPVILLLGSVLIFREVFSAQQWSGAAFVFGGLALFFHDRLTALRDMDRYGTGLMILIIAATFWAAYGLAQKKMTGLLGPQQVLMMTYAIGALMLLPVASPSTVLSMQLPGHLFAIAGMVITVLSYITFNDAMVRWDAPRVSAVIALTPLFTLFITHIAALIRPDLYAGEQHDALSWLGAATVVAGSLFVAMPRSRRA